MRRWLRIGFLILLGAVVGAGLGLYLGWVAWPTEFTDASPAVLERSYQRDYAVMIAAAYAVDGDLGAARARVADLGADGRDTFFDITLEAILRRENEADIRRLARLASDLGLASPALDPYLETPDE